MDENGKLWDFSMLTQRRKAWELVKTTKPDLLVGSPMCTIFSSLQRFNGWNEEKQDRYEQAVGHIDWLAGMYQEQIQAGRLFVHEHPLSSSSWELRSMRKLARAEGVCSVCDQCMFGMTAKDAKGKQQGMARKRTRFLTNSRWIAQELDRQCCGGHKHISLALLPFSAFWNS